VSAKTCNCLNEIDDKLRERNVRLVGYALTFPSLNAIATIKTEWIDLGKVPKGQKKKCPGMFASHCPFCGVAYPKEESGDTVAIEAIESTVFSLQEFIARQMAWSAKTFGETPRTKGITAHIRKELLEIEAAPTDVYEWVDVIILALDGAWRSGHGPAQIVAALQAKQEKNFARTYPKPASDDVPSEHVRTEVAS